MKLTPVNVCNALGLPIGSNERANALAILKQLAQRKVATRRAQRRTPDTRSRGIRTVTAQQRAEQRLHEKDPWARKAKR